MWLPAMNLLCGAQNRIRDKLHNTACERVFAFFGTIRGACHQIDSPMGAWTRAMWFSVVRTAHANEADERTCLQYVLEEGPGPLMEHGDWHWQEVPDGGWQSYDPGPLRTKDEKPYLEALMPWSDEYHEYERGFRERRRDEFMHYASLIDRAGAEATDCCQAESPAAPEPTALGPAA